MANGEEIDLRPDIYSYFSSNVSLLNESLLELNADNEMLGRFVIRDSTRMSRLESTTQCMRLWLCDYIWKPNAKALQVVYNLIKSMFHSFHSVFVFVIFKANKIWFWYHWLNFKDNFEFDYFVIKCHQKCFPLNLNDLFSYASHNSAIIYVVAFLLCSCVTGLCCWPTLLRWH